MLVTLKEINIISYEILNAIHVPADHIKIINDTIEFAHKRGKGTHGIGRVPIYVNRIQNGLMSADTPISVINDHNAILHIDAHNGFGQVAAYYAMNEAILRAEKYGISCVEVKDSNNFGTAGFFAKIAAENNMIGIVMGNSGPAIAVGKSGKAILGTNPVSIAMPSGEKNNPFLFDMATSMAARGKIRLAEKNGESIPEGWALNVHGTPTTNPSEALKGSMVPIGGYKGIGISMVIDLVAGMLSGSAFGGNVLPLNNNIGYSRYGNCIIVIDISSFIDIDTYKKNMIYFYQVVHDNQGIIPGELSYLKERDNINEVNISDKIIYEINHLTEKLNINYKL